jgi:cytochrome c oxidase assembly factor CtaG
VHALQHACFIGAGTLLWWPVLEPKRRRLRPELWKIGYFLGTRMVTMVIGMDFVFIRHPLYTGVYGAGTRKYGLSPIDDQQIGGGIMTTVDVYLMVFVLSLLFYRAAQQSARDEEAERAALAT